MTRPRCPEALYGEHGVPNTSGNCPYCGLHLGKPRTGRGTSSMTEEELARTSWDTRSPVERYVEQDPLAGSDPDDDYWSN